ncbi:MAG: hypothetical protein QME85_02580 [Candidatus Saccharicenans sp.]|nr:hypothetical protein [Candidatus Saccharicenans sp.]
MNKRFLPALKIMVLLLAVSELQAVVPRKWELRSREDFLKGKFTGASLSSDGVLSIGPRLEKLDLPAEEFYLSLAPGPDGSYFLGTGHGGKIYRLGKDKKAELYFQTAELDVTALAVDAKGILYAGTSPNGKIYKITAGNKGEEFFNPQERYIWDLMLTEKGNLLAAVGESGGIYEVNPAGAGRLLFKARDNHILCLVQTSGGDLLAGSGGRGQLYRISSSGRVSVIFDSGYEEVRNVVLDGQGNIYLSAGGAPSKPAATVSSVPAAPPAKAETEVSVTVSAVSVAAAMETEEISVPESQARTRTPAAVSGAIFQVTPDGLARKLWSSGEEIVYSLVYEAERQKLILGTGNQGRLYSLDRQGGLELLAQTGSEQVFGLFRFRQQTQVLGNNPCLLGLLQPDQNFSAEYLSPVLDARILSNWGRLSWEADLPQGASLQIQSRSGNTAEPDDTWSDWSPPYGRPDERVLSPAGRYLQLKISLKSPDARKQPRLQRLLVFYLQANVAPVINRLDVLPANQVFIKPPEQDEVILGLDEASKEGARRKDETGLYLTPKKTERQGFRTITWEASDENEDKLAFNIYIRREAENNWRLMQEKLTDKIFSFDTRNFPDGTYWLKVEATDLPSNPQGNEKKTEKTSQPLVIDNSLPAIKNFMAGRSAEGLEVSFVAEDSYSYIEEVKFLVRPGDWQLVFPVDGLCDSRSENFKFTVKIPAGSDNLLLIRVRDSFGNVGVHQHRF